MKGKIFTLLSTAILAGVVTGGCASLNNGGSCGFAYDGKTAVIEEDLENVVFVDTEGDVSLSFDYGGVTYSMDFSTENASQISGETIYTCTFSNSEGKECLGNIIMSDEAEGSAAGTVRFRDDMTSDEAFGFIVAPNASDLEDYRDALEEERIQLETWTDSAQQTQ